VARATKPPAVKVMTRNIYLGVDVTRPLDAAQGLEGLDALLAVAHEAHAMEDTLDYTNFRVRAKLLAREISRAKPDLVGLQEVAKWRSGPVEFLPPNVGIPNATHVDADYLKMLRQALKKAGTPYRAVAVQRESDVEVPSFLGNPLDPENPMTDAEDVRVTVSDVVLKRVGSDVRILRSGGGQYDAELALDLAGLTVSFVRGFAWVNARADGRKFRFVTTHLEAFSSGLALQQAQELLAGPAAYPGHTILVGDFNSDPLNSSVDGSGVVHQAAYEAVVGDGYFDEWLKWAPANQGWTSGLSETVDDDSAAGFDHRIDFVFGRSSAGKAFRVLSGNVTGDRLRDRDPATGLWPSDHAGVVLKLRLPRLR
jgi:endonuclease/exonuclease/phosphatase family metal-dependent hydrolase